MSDRDGRGPRPSRMYSLLLRLYPTAFRDRFGDAMAETFEEERVEARRRGRLVVAGLWLRTLVRTPALALEERLSSRGGSLAGPRTVGWVGRLAVDLRLSLRRLARSPGFSLATALTVGLGIGATASLHSAVHALLLRPLPVASPEELVRVEEVRNRHSSSGIEGARMTVQRFEQVRDGTTGTAFSSFAGHNFRGLSMRVDGPAFPVPAVIASGNYFEALGVRPALGRFFTEDHEPSAVISHALWQARFGSAPDVVGRTVHVGGRPFTVLGVTPREFTSTVGFLRPDLWVPVGAHEGAVWERARLATFGRLAPGLGRAAAQERAGAVMMRIPAEDDPDAEIRGARLEPMTATPPSMAGPLRRFLLMLLGAGVLVLLIAGANVAGVLTARTARRSRELAVRLALGAGRVRLVRQALLESTLLFGLGGLVGVGLAEAAGRLLSGVSLPTADPIVVDATPEAATLAFAVVAAVSAGVLFGLLPAVQASRTLTARVLRDGGRGASATRSRVRDGFVTAQVAMSVLLLVGAVLFVRTARAGMTRDPGFSADNVVVATVDLSPHGYEGERGPAFFTELRDRVEALPGVESAAWAELALLTGGVSSFSPWRLSPEEDGPSANQNTVDGHYFQTLGIPLLAGRPIEGTDVAGAPPVVVVNQSFAERFWPGENPVGKTLLRGETAYKVVGLVADGTYVEFGEASRRFAFLSLAQRPRAQQVLHIRHRPQASPAEVLDRVRREVARMDADVAVEDALPLTEAMGSLLFPQRLAALLVGSFGLLGLFLAATGVYAVLANQVVQRTREFGIRLALGADMGRLLRRLLRQGIVLALVGTAVGLAAAALLTRFVADLLHGVGPLDPVAFVGVPLLLGLVTLTASLVPARRILGLDPVETLKEE